MSMMHVLIEVCFRHQMSPEDARGKSRKTEAVIARHEAMYLMRQMTWEDGTPRYSLPQIGKFFGVDHSTVMNGIRRHKERNNL